MQDKSLNPPFKVGDFIKNNMSLFDDDNYESYRWAKKAIGIIVKKEPLKRDDDHRYTIMWNIKLPDNFKLPGFFETINSITDMERHFVLLER